MKRGVFVIAFVVLALALLPLQAKTKSPLSFEYGGNQESRQKGWGEDKDPKKESKNEYKFKFERTHDHKKEHDIAGNTKEGDKKGGWWVHGEHGGEWSWSGEGEKEKGNNHGKIGGKIGGGYSGSIDVGAQTGRAGNDRWNAQGRIAGKLKGEVKAALEAAIKNDDDFAGMVIEAAAEGTVSAEASATAAITVGGVPISITGKIEGHWGLSAHAGVKVGYEKKSGDKKSGKFVVQESVGASLGFGASETITVEMDAEAFCRAMGLEDEWNAFVEKMEGKNAQGQDTGNGQSCLPGDDPFDSEPENGDSSGSSRKFNGLKAFRLVD